MALSGSYDFTITRDDIITSALRRVRAVGQTDTPTATQITNSAQMLNMMVRAWRAKGIHLWAIEMFQQVTGTSSVVAGTDGNDYECILSHTASSTNRPITGANYATFWKATGGTGIGTGWVDTTPYISHSDFTLTSEFIGVEEAVVRRAYVDSPLRAITREEWIMEADKAAEGLPNRFFFERNVGGGSKVYILPRSSESTDIINMNLMRKLQDFDASADNPDLSDEWFEALCLNLASKLSSEYNLGVKERQLLKIEADEAFYLAAKGDREFTDLRVKLRLK